MLDSMTMPEEQPMTSEVTAIVPTTCETRRATMLWRCLNSLRVTSVDPVQVIVVVNGGRVDEQLFQSLTTRTDLRVIRREEGNLPHALLAGRRLVETPFFCFLDDDDEYLPDAIDIRLTAIKDGVGADVVATNGIRRIAGRDAPAQSLLSEASGDPLAALFRENWLASCGGLFRSATVTEAFFENSHAYQEWTWLAFQLVNAGMRVRLLETATYVINDTTESASKAPASLENQLVLYDRMRAAGIRRDLRPMLHRRRATTWHMISERELRSGSLRRAWHAHLRSLCHPAGWRFAAFTRKLVTWLSRERHEQGAG